MKFSLKLNYRSFRYKKKMGNFDRPFCLLVLMTGYSCTFYILMLTSPMMGVEGSHVMISESKEVPEFEMIHTNGDYSDDPGKKKKNVKSILISGSNGAHSYGVSGSSNGENNKINGGDLHGPGPIVVPDLKTNEESRNDYEGSELLELDEETMGMLDEKTKRLMTIEELSTLNCQPGLNEEFKMMKDVKLSTEFANVIMEKVDMIVSFLYKLKKYETRIRNKKEVERDEQEVYKYVLETVKEAYSIKDVRLLVVNTKSTEQTIFSLGRNEINDPHHSPTSTSVPFGENSEDLLPPPSSPSPVKENLIKIRVKNSELDRAPWYFNPNAELDHGKFMSYYDRPNPKSTYHHNKIMDIGMNGSSYWTWPYFNCSQVKNQRVLRENELIIRSSSYEDEHSKRKDFLRNSHNSNGGSANGHHNSANGGGGRSWNEYRENFRTKKSTWITSYTAWFPIRTKERMIEEYGELSLDLDITNFEINPCGFTNEKEREKDMFKNPLYYFRDTHKCDRLRGTSICHFIPGNPWRLGSYECKCRRNMYAYNKALNNTIAGAIAEAAWWTMRENKTNGKDSIMYQDIVTCKECPDGCENCIDGVSCLAPISWVFRLVLLCVSVICSVGSVALIFVTYKFRKTPVLKSSSPLFHGITLCGCVIMYSEMIALFPVLSQATCIAVKWSRHLGFCVTYTALYMKLCRVFLTFRVKSAHKIKLTEKHLLHWMSPVMVVMLLYLFAWTISDPPSIEPMFTTEELKFYQCVYNWWDHSLSIGEVIFLGYGVWICWRIRENTDAQFISYSIYNIAFTNVIMVTFHLLLVPQAGPDMKYLLAFVRTQLSTTVTIALVFGSKLLSVLRGDPKALKDIPTSANGFGHETLDLEEENQQLKEELTKMATQIEKLKSYAMCKNNPHLKHSSVNVNITTDGDHSKLDAYASL